MPVDNGNISSTEVTEDLAKTIVSAIVDRDGDEITDCWIGFGYVVPVPMRTTDAEAILRNGTYSNEIFACAGVLYTRKSL